MNFDEINRVITFELNEEDFFLEPEKARLNILNAYQKAKKIGKVTKSVFLCRIKRVVELVRFMEKREVATREELLAAIKEPVFFDKEKRCIDTSKKN